MSDREFGRFHRTHHLQRRASFQTRKGRCSTLILRMILSENRFRFSGSCAGPEAPQWLARKAPKVLNLHITEPKIETDFWLGSFGADVASMQCRTDALPPSYGSACAMVSGRKR
ncbi:MAG: hypothetical protein E5V65_08805 [Mesorhizobium sp.]|nr:MAG: hypothetical protein E5V65_08805 [Mesorhizobium sp.]